MRGVVWIEGAETSPPERGSSWGLGIVSPEHLRTLGQALLAGRGFTFSDGPEAAKVMMVNEVIAKRYGSGECCWWSPAWRWVWG
jgi:hypothetical protein